MPEATRSFPRISRTATGSHLFGGFAFGEFDLFVLVGPRIDGMVHEMTHLLLDEAIDSPLARVPSWLNEGLAMYFESSSQGRQRTVDRAAREGRLMPLRSMTAVPGRPVDVALFYSQAWSIVKHMMDVHGEERMAALLQAINGGSRTYVAVTEVYGMTLEELQEEWQASLFGGAAPVVVQAPDTSIPGAAAPVVVQSSDTSSPGTAAPAVAQVPDPRSVATAALAAGAVAVAVTLSGAIWLVRRASRPQRIQSSPREAAGNPHRGRPSHLL